MKCFERIFTAIKLECNILTTLQQTVYLVTGEVYGEEGSCSDVGEESCLEMSPDGHLHWIDGIYGVDFGAKMKEVFTAKNRVWKWRRTGTSTGLTRFTGSILGGKNEGSVYSFLFRFPNFGFLSPTCLLPSQTLFPCLFLVPSQSH